MKKTLIISALSCLLTSLGASSYAQFYEDSVTFEVPVTTIIIDTATNDLWQIGHPGKTFFDGAYAGMNALLTDTIDPYPPNDTSSFIYVIRNPYTQTCLSGLQFWHKYDTDTLNDIGIIEASYDGGRHGRC